MAGITLLQAQTQLDVYLAASTAVSLGQSYTIDVGGNRRVLVRADLSAINESIKFWNNEVKNLSRQASGRSRARTVVAR